MSNEPIHNRKLDDRVLQSRIEMFINDPTLMRLNKELEFLISRDIPKYLLKDDDSIVKIASPRIDDKIKEIEEYSVKLKHQLDLT